jgi:hypothetical protein
MMNGMRRLVLATILLALLAGCAAAQPNLPPRPNGSGVATTAGTASIEASSTTEASPTGDETVTPARSRAPIPSPKPRATAASATAASATAGAASTGPAVTTKPEATFASSPGPTPIGSVPPLFRPGLRYVLVDGLGRPFFCDPDFYPVARVDELQQARRYIGAIRADAPTYASIVGHLGINPIAAPTDSQVLDIYREWKMLRAVVLTEKDGRFAFDYVAADGTSDTSGWHVAGKIDTDGTIALDQRDPSGPPPCPICLARGTLIGTPVGPRRVEDLRPGMPVWTSDAAGRRLPGFVLAIGSMPVPLTHEVVHLVLSDGRTVDVSPGHPLPDGRRLGTLRVGDLVDGATVVSADLDPYDGGATFDLLPSGPTGTYWANGIHLASTLASGR